MSRPGNQEQIDYWNGNAGSTWVDAQERMDKMLAPLTSPLIEQAAAGAGERIIDVGCGCGDTSLQLAAKGASVLGLDISEPMLARARARAQLTNQANVEFTTTDAASAPLSADHDLIFSRFGVMFFSDPTAAFSNLHSGLSDKGRLCFLCWQPPRNNPWMSTAGAAINEFMPEPETKPDPRAPGPFAFADSNYLTDTLENAGFKNISISPLTATLHIADTLDEAMDSQQQIGPLARALADLEGEAQAAALNAAREALADKMTPAGLDLGAACWLVKATKEN